MVIPVLEQGEHSLRMAERLNAPLVQTIPDSYYLFLDLEQWIVKDGRQGPNFSLRVNLLHEVVKIQRQKISVKKDLLSKALGLKGEGGDCVLDGSLGLARDAAHIVAQGAKVIGYERNPIPFLLVESALEQAPQLKQQLRLFQGDCLEGLKRWHDQVSCLYLDPMFEDVRKKSAPKKELAFLREITAVESDVRRVIGEALELGVKRVVVKRPIKSEQLNGKANIVYEGKLVRYDVYTR